ncbi:hypothetical protein AMECASPLE_038918 [Ameca splendens]|uniref:Uncharacterized protein n=1 Tax=Ameca splendens TaxID=208324 RepID=A0ABV0ZH23_9TELE
MLTGKATETFRSRRLAEEWLQRSALMAPVLNLLGDPSDETAPKEGHTWFLCLVLPPWDVHSLSVYQ